MKKFEEAELEVVFFQNSVIATSMGCDCEDCEDEANCDCECYGDCDCEGDANDCGDCIGD